MEMKQIKKRKSWNTIVHKRKGNRKTREGLKRGEEMKGEKVQEKIERRGSRKPIKEIETTGTGA
jgi:hypothetical protein